MNREKRIQPRHPTSSEPILRNKSGFLAFLLIFPGFWLLKIGGEFEGNAIRLAEVGRSLG